MSTLRILFILCGLLSSLRAQAPPFEATIAGTPNNHVLSWTSRLGYNYRIERSETLQTWTDMGIERAGTSLVLEHCFTSKKKRLSYRIRETRDLSNCDFLQVPLPGEEFDTIDGVCFAFDLNCLPELPAAICISKRPAAGGSWVLIGKVTDIAEIDMLRTVEVEHIRTVRGSTVWVADEEGEFEVQAIAKDENGTTLGSATRFVTIGHNEPPVITILSGPPSPSATAQPLLFTTEVSDPDGDVIRRVEFYDNGNFIGADSTAPFGNQFVGIEGYAVPIPQALLRGTHQITAKAFDSRGTVGETQAALLVEITGGNARPELEITSPADGTELYQGGLVYVTYSVSDPDGEPDIDTVRLSEGNSYYDDDPSATFLSLLTIASGWHLGTHDLAVRAVDADGAESYPRHVRVVVKSASTNLTAADLAASIADETTALPTNEIYSGVIDASGLFEDGLLSGLQMDRGALFTTGQFSFWDDGDDNPASGRAWNSLGDFDLQVRAAGTRTADAAILEFDCYCTGSQLECELQFGSEEYIEYAGDVSLVGCFNDAFMVTVDGVLISLTPDCLDIIAVNSIHPFLEADDSFCGLPTDFLPRREHLYLDDDLDIKPLVLPENHYRRVEYNGMTIRLRLHAFVTPAEVHRIRIVVADVNDPVLDTGVFIKEGSLLARDPNQ